MPKHFYPTLSEVFRLSAEVQLAIIRPVKVDPFTPTGVIFRGTKPSEYRWFGWVAETFTGIESPFPVPGKLLYGRERFHEHKDGRIEYYFDNPLKWATPRFLRAPSYMGPTKARLWLQVQDLRACKLMDLTNEEIYDMGVRIADAYTLGISTGCEGSEEAFNLGEGIRRVFFEMYYNQYGRKVINPWIWYCRVEKAPMTDKTI